MTQDKYTAPDNTTQTGTAYKNNIDNAFEANERGVGSMFQGHEESTPAMTVRLEAGVLWDGPGNDPVALAAQSCTTITAPVTNPRIDRIVVDKTTGAVSIIAGSEAASPVPTAVTTGKIPICYVTLATSTTSIINTLITDERPSFLGDPGAGGSFLANVVEDTTPQLGGDLDLNAKGIDDSNANEMIVFTETASAVNHLSIANAATAGDVTLAAVGDDTNIDFALTPKAAGNLVLDGLAWPNADGSANQVLQTDGAGALSFATASGGGLTLIETQTISSAVANVTMNTSIDSYDYIVIHIDAMVAASSSYAQISVSVDDGSTYEGGQCFGVTTDGSSYTHFSDTSGTSFDFLRGVGSPSTNDIIIEIFNMGGEQKLLRSTATIGSTIHTSNLWVDVLGKLDHIYIARNTDNINSAVIRVYGS